MHLVYPPPPPPPTEQRLRDRKTEHFKGLNWEGGGAVGVTCPLSVNIFDICRLSVNLSCWLTKQVNYSYSLFNSHSWNSIRVKNLLHSSSIHHLIAVEPQWSLACLSYTIVYFTFVWKFVFIPMIMASHMTPLLTFCEFGSGWGDQSEHESNHERISGRAKIIWIGFQ